MRRLSISHISRHIPRDAPTRVFEVFCQQLGIGSQRRLALPVGLHTDGQANLALGSDSARTICTFRWTLRLFSPYKIPSDTFEKCPEVLSIPRLPKPQLCSESESRAQSCRRCRKISTCISIGMTSSVRFAAKGPIRDRRAMLLRSWVAYLRP